MEPIIAAQDLGKRYPDGTVALQGLTLQVRSGEMVGVLGPSGAGKTTLFRLLNGSLLPTAGRLRVLGYHLGSLSGRRLRALRRRVALIYQQHHLVPNLSVFHNVLMGKLGALSALQALRAFFYPSRKDLEEVWESLAAVGLEEKLHTRAQDLSGGQQQRVAVARILLQDAPIILADEPIASVDIHTATLLLDLFRELNERRGRTILLSLHQVDFALRYCARLVALSQGRLVYDGPPRGLDAAAVYQGVPTPREEAAYLGQPEPSHATRVYLTEV